MIYIYAVIDIHTNKVLGYFSTRKLAERSMALTMSWSGKQSSEFMRIEKCEVKDWADRL